MRFALHDQTAGRCRSERPVRSARILPSGDARTPAAHNTVRVRIISFAAPPLRNVTASASIPIHERPFAVRTPSSLSCASAFGERSAGKAWPERDRRPREAESATGRIDVAKIVAQRVPGNLSESARQLDAGRSAAHDHEVEPFAANLRIRLALGVLECQQHATPNLGGVLDGFQAGRDGRPLIVAEIMMASTPWRESDRRTELRHPQNHLCGLRISRSVTSASSTSVLRCLPQVRIAKERPPRRERARRSPPDRAAAGRGENCGDRARVTANGAIPRFCAAYKPPKPPPTITTDAHWPPLKAGKKPRPAARSESAQRE